MSHDKDILYRDLEETKVWTREKWIDKEYENLNELETYKYDTDKNHNHATDIVINAINGIVDNGHPQVRTASLSSAAALTRSQVAGVTISSICRQILPVSRWIWRVVQRITQDLFLRSNLWLRALVTTPSLAP